SQPSSITVQIAGYLRELPAPYPGSVPAQGPRVGVRVRCRGKPALPRSSSTLDRVETVPVACPSVRRTSVSRGHFRATPIPADLHRRRSAEPPPEPSKLVIRVWLPSSALI